MMHHREQQLPTKTKTTTTTKLQLSLKKSVLWRISTLRRCLRSFWKRFHACWMLKSSVKCRHYRAAGAFSSPPPPHPPAKSTAAAVVDHGRDPSDLVSLKITLFGDSHAGKTSFLTTFVGEEQGQKQKRKQVAVTGINQVVAKTLDVKGARISYSVWEVEGDHSSLAHIQTACKDSVAILFMFDLTSRRTLNSVIKWYQEVRKWNQAAIPVLIGTKFDEFVKLPIDLQWAISKQARSYAKALKATLFFSSATYNINVNKIFKFITAELFNLHWNLKRNLTVGEPIIDF
ncbi:septum-promoting GTP-binding protein 1-like [Andrographis paniculata]|uniref:septum-promoting GTP-binding protein 1-like n=1 Tax=Andrographis paniculata TaxID=175694 RepID=UPI0021E8B5E8|nr:septum-promoting GTP-binding protein 1-like [Andrographis paniculata]